MAAAQAQNASSLKTEYLDDFAETCKYLDQLLQAIPANKYAWRPGAGVPSVSEVHVHIASGNFLLLSVTRMMKSSLDEVRNRFSQLTAAELDGPADFFGEKTTVRRIYLPIFAHVNEHYGQSVAYARVNGIVPPGLRNPSDVRDVYIENGEMRFRS